MLVHPVHLFGTLSCKELVNTWNVSHVSVISLVLSYTSSLLFCSLILSATCVNYPSISHLLGILPHLSASEPFWISYMSILDNYKKNQTPSVYLSLSISLFGSQKLYPLLLFNFSVCICFWVFHSDGFICMSSTSYLVILYTVLRLPHSTAGSFTMY